MAELIGRIILWAGELSSANVTRLEAEGWLPCDGTTRPSDGKFHPLFDIIQDNFKHDPNEVLVGQFRLPDLQGRVPIGAGRGNGLTITHLLGRSTGLETVTLTVENLARHRHAIGGRSGEPQRDHLGGSTSSYGISSKFEESTLTDPDALEPKGDSKPFAIMQPSLPIHFLIRWKA